MERQTRLGVDGDKFSRREKVTTGELELKTPAINRVFCLVYGV